MKNQDDVIKADLKKMYDLEAETYDRAYHEPAGRYFMRRKIETALSLATFEKGTKLLEVGCADGPYTFEFARMGFQMTGYDLSSECVKVATERAKSMKMENVNFVAGDAENLETFPDNTFDGAISFSTLRYVPNPQKAVNEIFRAVKSHRPVVLDFPNKLSPWFNYLRPWLIGSHIHDNQYTTKTVKGFMRNAGFQDIVAKRILYTPKFIKPDLLKVMKFVDIVGEWPILNICASIIMCRGIKP